MLRLFGLDFILDIPFCHAWMLKQSNYFELMDASRDKYCFN